VRGQSDEATATEALTDFQRFPQWMWRNADVVDFVGWLRSRNDLAVEPLERTPHSVDQDVPETYPSGV